MLAKYDHHHHPVNKIKKVTSRPEKRTDGLFSPKSRGGQRVGSVPLLCYLATDGTDQRRRIMNSPTHKAQLRQYRPRLPKSRVDRHGTTRHCLINKKKAGYPAI
ncbi:MAG TPA: hypothetical protein G4O12_07165 [Dehalococcoidia bacterium]|nr:hypothetical protein [Dehalococcoidia bacterium]